LEPKKLPRKHVLSLKKRRVISLIITALIVTILLFPSQVRSLTVQISGLKGQEIIQGRSFTFYIEVKIESTERVPINSIRIIVEGPTSFTYLFPVSGGQEYYLKLEPFESIISGYSYNFGYGYGYGYYYGYGYGYFSQTPPYGYGYGYYPTLYGYGYGYGYGFYGPQTLRWKATLLNTGTLPTGEYKIKVEVNSDGVWWGGAPTEVNFFTVSPPPPPAPPIPTAEELEAMPLEEAVETIAELPPTEAASILEQVSPERATEIIVELPSERAADIMESLPIEKAVDIIESGVSLGLTENLTTVVLQMNPENTASILVEANVTLTASLLDATVEVNATGSAVIVERMIEIDLPRTVTILEEMSTESLASLIIEITELPSTPETAAKLLENMSLEKAVEVTRFIIELGRLDDLGKIFGYLSTERLNDIFEALTISERSSVMPYLTSETVAKIRQELLPLPDLTLTSITVTPSEPTAQEECGVKVLVKNIGNVKASGIIVKIEVNGITIQTQTVDDLEAGSSRTLTFSWTPTAAGDYTLKATVDPENLIKELNENNNVISTTVTVKPKELPDLTVQFQEIPEKFEVNKEYEIKVLVKNIGTAAADTFNVELTVNGARVEKKEIKGLAEGASEVLTFSWTPTAAGDYTLKATVDPENLIKELNENNNVATVSVSAIEVVPPPPFPWTTVIAAAAILIIVIIAIILVLKRKK